MLSFKIPDFHPPEALEKSQWAFETIIREGFVSLEIDFKKKTGEVFTAEVSSSLFEIGDKKVIQGIVRDITERKLSEKALHQSEERLSLAEDIANLGLWEWRLDIGEIYDSSGKFPEISGLTHEEARNFSLDLWMGRVHPDDRKRFEEKFQAHFRGETERVENELRIKHPKKGWRWLYGIGRVVERDKDGKPIRFVGVHQDITERKRVEKEREKLIKDLQEALKEIKTLRGILPLCSFCKKIRDDKGYWEQVDVYIYKHLQADISHSLCPDCAKEHYPDLDIHE